MELINWVVKRRRPCVVADQKTGYIKRRADQQTF